MYKERHLDVPKSGLPSALATSKSFTGLYKETSVGGGVELNQSIDCGFDGEGIALSISHIFVPMIYINELRILQREKYLTVCGPPLHLSHLSYFSNFSVIIERFGISCSVHLFMYSGCGK